MRIASLAKPNRQRYPLRVAFRRPGRVGVFDPFQLLVAVAGGEAFMMDVYFNVVRNGIDQVLHRLTKRVFFLGLVSGDKPERVVRLGADQILMEVPGAILVRLVEQR